MQVQQLIYQVEELKALVNLFEQGQQALAQASILAEALPEDADQEHRDAVDASLDQLNKRMRAVERMLTTRTRTEDVEAAIENVQEHISRLQHYQQLRAEQLQLKTHLELELSLGGLAAETRKQAEDSLEELKNRVEAVISSGHAALGTPNLIQLV